MIVRLEVTASEKVAARSQYEPNGYSVLVSVDQLEIGHPDELLAQADTLFRRAKEAIANARKADGLEAGSASTVAPGAAHGHGNGSTSNGHNRLPATDKQLELIRILARKASLSPDELERLSLEAVGQATAQLDRYEASRLIGALQHLTRAGGA